MNRKVIVLVVEGVILALFLISGIFFYQSRMLGKMMEGYRGRSKDIEQLSSQNKEVVDTFRKIKQTLTEKVDGLELEKEKLAQEVEGFAQENKILIEENQQLLAKNKEFIERGDEIYLEIRKEMPQVMISEDILIPIKDKISDIALLIDKQDLTGRKRVNLDSLLRSVHKALNALDFDLAKILDTEPLYREKVKEKQAQLNIKIKEIEELKARIDYFQEKLLEREKIARALEKENRLHVRDKKDERERLVEYSRRIEEVIELKAKIRELLEREKEVVGYYDQLLKLRRERAQLDSQINQLRKEKEELAERVDTFERERDQYVRESKIMAEEIRELQAREEDVRSLKAEVIELRQDYAKVSSQNTLAQEKIEEMQLELATRAEQIVAFQRALEGRNSVLLELSAKFQERLKETTRLRANIVKTKLENSYLLKELQDKENSLSAFHQFKKYIDDASKTLATDEKEVRVEIESVEPDLPSRRE